MEVLGKPISDNYVHSSDDCSDLDLETEDYIILDDSDDDPTFEPSEFTRSNVPAISLKKKSKPRSIPEGKGNKSALDPTELTSHLSTLSLKKKSKPRVPKGMGDRSEEEGTDSVEFISPELNATDQKSFEAVEKMIHSGMIEKLKLDQCKVYLRKHGLRLTGNKEILLKRIKEHLEIIDGGGQRKYPAFSFILNCKGDACTGDVVMFEQNVYEMYSIASRSATGPSCGKRTVAGRIVKESYGAEKQQHTFTIEVLWSNGEKPLPPLHPLLIKGRNLYRLKTLRQRWEDEDERQKMLSEKHARGSLARSDRDARLVEKEKRKILRTSKPINSSKRTCQPTKNTSAPLTGVQVQHRSEPIITNRSHDYEQQQGHVPYEPLINHPVSRRRPLDKMKEVLHSNGGGGGGGFFIQNHNHNHNHNHHHPLQRPFEERYNTGWEIENQIHYGGPPHHHHPPPPSFRGGRENQFHSTTSFDLIIEAFTSKDFPRRQPCRFYAQGRCTYGERCKFLHE